MKLNNFLARSLLIEVDLVIGFQLQSVTYQIFESFLSTNILQFFNLRGLMTPNLIHTICTESITRLYV